MLVALVGNAVILIETIVPLLGSVPPKVVAGIATLVVPPGLNWLLAVVVFAVGRCSIPKF